VPRIFDNIDLDILLSPRKNRELELMSAPHTYTKAGRYTVAVKVIDIFGNDTMTGDGRRQDVCQCEVENLPETFRRGSTVLKRSEDSVMGCA